MNRDQVSAARMISLGLVGSEIDDPAEVVRRLSCVQAQALRGALVSLALRTRSGDLGAVRSAVDSGAIVRTWTQRGTIHLVTAESLGGVLAVTGSRQLTAEATRRHHYGVSEEMLEEAAVLAEAAIGERGPLSREELLEVFAPLLHGVGPEEAPGRRRHLVTALSMQGRLVQSGFVAGRDEFAYTLRDPSLDSGIDPEEALREWMRRYVLSHGPVTEDDAARWTGLPKTPLRSALAALVDAGMIVRTAIDEREHYSAPDLEDRLGAAEKDCRGLHLLPGFDELILGYKDRSGTLDPAHEKAVVPGGNGMFKNTVVDGTRVRGTWKRSARTTGPRVLLTPFPGEVIDADRVEAAAAGHPGFV